MDKNSEILISVIIPAYNAEKYISRAIDSALYQNHKNIEIIVINDGSKDNTEQIVKSYGNTIKYCFQENKGVAEARNFGISISKGDYVAFLDADDYVLPEMYSKMLMQAIHSNSDMVLCGIFLENEKGIRRRAYTYNQTDYDLERTCDLKKAFQIIGNSSCNKIYKKSLISDIKFPKFKRGEDALFVLECLLKMKKISCVNEPLYVYFQNSLSVTKSFITLDVLENYKLVHNEKRKLIKYHNHLHELGEDLQDYYTKYFLMYTNGIRKIRDTDLKKKCWAKWLEMNKKDFIKDTVLKKITDVHENIHWTYYSGMIATGKFIDPVLNRINNLKFYLNR